MSDAAAGESARRTGTAKSKIFISYRRRETAGHAGRLYDGLSEHFGAERVFMDVTMEPGVDFAETIREAIGDCGALVALIGEEWLTISDEVGNRRIDDPADIHRMELEAALDRRVRLIPALVQDAQMPSADDLPDGLRALVRRQAVELSDQRWDYDVTGLIDVLERVLSDQADAGRPVGRATRWRRRAGRTLARVRRLALRHRGKAGFAAGALSALIVIGAVLAATGYFTSPLLSISAFDSVPPRASESVAQRCLVRVESDYRVRSARFVVDGDSRNSLEEQTSPPWQCNNRGNRNEWDTCEGHSRGFPLDDSRPHTLTATVTDSQGNTATRTRTVDTNCPGGPG